MANSELYGKTFQIPNDVLERIKKHLVSHPDVDGSKRAKFLLKNGTITYQSLKRLKNFFDTFNPQQQNQVQYELAGGDKMKGFVESTLNAKRDAVTRSKQIKNDADLPNRLGVKAQKTPRLDEDTKKDVDSVALGVVVDGDNRILLLKRNYVKDGWGNGQWALVGGTIEGGEDSEETLRREIKEECKIDVDKVIKKFSIKRNDIIEYIFLCTYSGHPDKIQLNDEHIEYGWFKHSDIKYLDTVPNLKDYISISIKKYD